MLLSCIRPPVLTMNVTNFKTTFPFVFVDNKIFIETKWGEERKSQLLLFDTHAPSSSSEEILKRMPQVRQLNAVSYNTRTAEGKRMMGNLYVADSIHIGDVCFSNIVLYSVPLNPNPAYHPLSIAGVMGDNLISKGVWKINFSDSTMEFASSIDSISDLEHSIKIPAENREGILSINSTMPDGTVQKMAIDFGYNKAVLIPIEAFRNVNHRGMGTVKTALYSTPSGNISTNNYEISDSIKLNGFAFETMIRSNDFFRYRIVGIEFFKSFEYIVLDYKSSTLYLSANRLTH